MQYPHKQIEPFGTFIVQLGDLPAFGVSRPYGGYSYYETLAEAVAELDKHWTWQYNSYKRNCAGKAHASRVLSTISRYRMTAPLSKAG